MHLPLIHNLHFSWTGWPKDEFFPKTPPDGLFVELYKSWENDGLRTVSHSWNPAYVQFTHKALPHLSPVDISRLSKGRLQYSLRSFGYRSRFSRKVSLRSVGENKIDTVLDYVATQLDRSELIDQGYVNTLNKFSWENSALNLEVPTKSSHGRYWYDLHIVVVTESRYRIGDEALMQRLQACVLESEVVSVRSLSVMPDHLHLVCRGQVAISPLEIVLDFWNRINEAAGFRLFSEQIYVGTFSVYTLGAVRGVDQTLFSTGASPVGE